MSQLPDPFAPGPGPADAVPPAQPPAVGPPPGWYPQGGAARWWDGQAWGPWMAPQQPEEKTLAVVVWVVAIVAGIIGPLIMYLAIKDKRFVRHHAADALNLDLLFLVAGVGLPLLLVLLGAITALIAGGVAAGLFIAALIVFYVVMLFGSFARIGLCIYGIVKAAQGEWVRIPLPFRFVKGGLAPGEPPPYVPR